MLARDQTTGKYLCPFPLELLERKWLPFVTCTLFSITLLFMYMYVFKIEQEKDVEGIKQCLIDGYENSFWTCSVAKLGYSGTAIISRVCLLFSHEGICFMLFYSSGVLNIGLISVYDIVLPESMSECLSLMA